VNLRTLLAVAVLAALAAVTACQPIRGTLPRGLRPPALIQVDLAVDGSTVLRLRTPASSWRPGTVISTSLPVGSTGGDVVAFDIDANGSVELVQVTPAGGASALRAVQVQPPTGGLVIERLVALPAPGPGRLTAAIDLDDDGRTDLVSLRVDNASNGSAELSSVTAASDFSSGPSGELPITADGTWSGVATLDANGDCRSDLALVQAGDQPRLVVLDGSARFTRIIFDARPALGPALGPAVGTRQVISPDDDLGGSPSLWVLDTDGSGATSLRTLNASSGFASPSGAFPLPEASPSSRFAAPANPPLGGPVESIPVMGRDQMVSVGGMLVHRCIAGRVQRFLTEARAAGFALSGTGWRSTAEQGVLRRRACGARAATAPTEACRPPTAPVGLSMHERGLAVDLRVNGRSITSRASPAYRWIAANAGRFGLKNYPLEPWHWSTNGE